MHPLVKIINIDGFFNQDQATSMYNCVRNLEYKESEFGKEIPEFYLIAPDANEQFSAILGAEVEVLEEYSGRFRYPSLFIHFEGFDTLNEWIFAVALDNSTFNVYESLKGPKNALEGHDLPYRDLFAWDLTINYLLKPGQGVMFRPWLFHSFDSGLIQTFRLREKNGKETN
jgi:hypothetical protein